MNRYAREYEDSKSSPNNVIPFPLSTTSSTSETSIESLLSDALTNPEIEAHLKGIVEAAVLDAWVRTQLLDIERLDDPFDAIYMSQLKADPIVPADLGRMKKYTDIVDLSSTISFEDEWED